ncbi:MAG TPA: carboxypeptidase-like regulatory domain-containing protein, partial [Chitinophaga sp.]|uniref:carboxypeptidase-like regulatory domain-containing protein n=1 Tax=Chitinophaga sp. TaxID=1869181 RepID=UPI002F9568A6
MLRSFFVVACCFLLSDAMAQNNLLNTKFHCRAAAGNAHKLLHDLAAYSRFNIEYSPVILDSTVNITLPDGETSLGKVLNRILSGQRVSVIEKNNKIIILHADAPLPADALLEKHMLYGFIQQENSLEPIPFASLRDVSAKAICESNVYGFYSIILPAGEHVLQVSFTGSSSKTVTIDLTKNTQLNFFLSPALLPETQVAAGNMLKRDASIKLDRYQAGLYSNM